MQERDLVRELERLGLDAESARAIALLPLVEVAWADGRAEVAERREIVDIAKKYDLLKGRGGEILKKWLTEKPSPEYFERGRKLFVRLALRRTGVGADIPETSLESIVKLCADVADAAGGLFGWFFTTSDAEKLAIARIAHHIESEADKVTFDPKAAKIAKTITADWNELMAEFGDDATSARPRKRG